MNGEEILKLIDAGFTADEVRKMQTTADEPANEKTEPSTSDEKHEGEIEPNDKGKDINTDFMDSITKAVSELTDKVKAIQDNNIKHTTQETKRDMTADDVIKSFVESM